MAGKMTGKIFRSAVWAVFLGAIFILAGCKTMDGLVMTGKGVVADTKVVWGSMIKADDWMRKDFW